MKGLSQRLAHSGPLCSIFGVEEEIKLLHCLRDCVIATLIWDVSDFGGEVEGVWSSFVELSEACLERLHGLNTGDS